MTPTVRRRYTPRVRPSQSIGHSSGVGQVAQAQEFRGRIVGKVIDASTASALPNAEVSIEKTGVSTFADLDGRFRFSDVPAGTYRLQARLIGYAPKDRRRRRHAR